LQKYFRGESIPRRWHACDLQLEPAVPVNRSVEIFEQERVDRLSTEKLIRGLCADDERPWNDYQDQDGRISDRQLARLLRPFGIAPKSIRIGDKTPKGYKRSCFDDAFDRYLPPSIPDPASTATNATVN
jgi:hypothetical protein